MIILNILLHKPDMYLKEMQEELNVVHGVNVYESALRVFLKKNGFTRQRMRIVAARQDQLLREMFAVDVGLYDPSMLVFLDETGTDMRDSLRRYGYSVRGKPIASHKLGCRGKRVSTIVAMTATGVLDYRLTKDTVDSDEFKDFVEDLLPMLTNFNGRNPNSIIIVQFTMLIMSQDC